MKLPFSINSVYIINIECDNNVACLFLRINEVDRMFTATLNDGVIPVATSSDELSNLLMKLMPQEPAIYKKLYQVVWDYKNGNEVLFPLKLI